MATQEQSLDIRVFTGMNSSVDPTKIQDNEAASILNLLQWNDGSLIRRPPITGSDLGNPTSSHSVMGPFRIGNGNPFFLDATPDLNLRKADLVNGVLGSWSIIGSGGLYQHAVQYANAVYIIAAISVWKWDGTTLTNIAGSPGGGFITVFKDRLFVIDFNGTVNRLYYCNVGDPLTWSSTGFIDVNTGDGDILVCAYPIGDKLLLFKLKSVWSLYVQGAPLTWILRLTRRNIGCSSYGTLSEKDGILYFYGPLGIYTTDGTDFNIISAPIKNKIPPHISYFTGASSQGCHFGDYYLIQFYANAGNPETILVFNTVLKGWVEWSFPTVDSMENFVWVKDNSNDTVFFQGRKISNGHVRLYSFKNPDSGFDTGLDEGNTAFTVTFVSKKYEFNTEYYHKRGKLLLMNLSFTAPLSLTYTTEKTTETVSLTDTLSTPMPIKQKGPGMFKTLQMTLSTATSYLNLYSLALKFSSKRELSRSGNTY